MGDRIHVVLTIGAGISRAPRIEGGLDKHGRDVEARDSEGERKKDRGFGKCWGT